MKKEIDYFEIEQYFLGELKGDTLINFEKKLQNDSDFAKEVSLYKEINNTLSSRFSNYDEENKLRNTLEDIGNTQIKNTKCFSKPTVAKKTKVFSIMSYTKYLVAASVILFASIFWINSKKEAPSYYDYNQIAPIELTVRGDNNETLIKAQNAFNNKNFVEAEHIFRSLLAEDSTKTALQLYLGICLLEQNKFELADKIFNTIIQGNSVYKNKAIWHLALSKLKQKDYKNCKKVLKTLSKDADDYQKAKDILKKIN